VQQQIPSGDLQQPADPPAWADEHEFAAIRGKPSTGV
jgi:hypothetical protein